MYHGQRSEDIELQLPNINTNKDEQKNRNEGNYEGIEQEDAGDKKKKK